MRHLATVTAAALLTATASAQGTRVVLPGGVVPERYDLAVTPDAQGLTFSGEVSIALDVRAPTRTIMLNAADLAISDARLDAAQATVSFDKVSETATFTFPGTINPGHHTLAIRYTGKIYQQASGLFALDYDSAGAHHRALFTQFENSDARRFVPSWDEPGIKSVWQLTATVPAAEMAVSNMPVAHTDGHGATKTVHFAATPRMSSYLLFFGAGDFERVHRQVGAVDVGVIVKRGDTAKAGLALDTAAQILPYYNDYFGQPFPLPKLDMIAGPGSSQFFGAMENWGAIFYFERDLLNDPKITTETERQQVYLVVAHEMAHQWFGDLVTMAWWDDLWLNEGFASWMEHKAMDRFHPEWHTWLQALDEKQAAMQIDARDGTHPIITPILDVQQAAGAFDTITYEKGMSVIRMLEAYVGPDTFRAGVRRYMAAHKYGNTVTDDLWRAIDRDNPRPLTDIAHAFTLQAGVPLLRVTSGSPGYTLATSRFSLDESGNAGGRWPVPVLAGAMRLEVPAAGTLAERTPLDGRIINAGQTGYFRVAYDAPSFARVAADYARATPEDQLGLLNDSYTLAAGGAAPVGNFLTLATRLPAGADPVVTTTLVGRLAVIDDSYGDQPSRAAYRAWARRLLAPAMARIGWSPHAGETANVAPLRTALLQTLAQLGDVQVIAEARRRFADGRATLPSEERRTVYGIVAENADVKTWDQLHEMALAAPSKLEKSQFYALLGLSRDPVLATRALDLALTNEPDPTDRPAMIAAVGRQHPEQAFAFTAAHWQQIVRLLEPTTQARFAARIAGNSAELSILPQLDTFTAANIPTTARRDTAMAVSSIHYAARLRSEMVPAVNAWLATNAG